MIVLFGCDGGKIEKQPLYWGGKDNPSWGRLLYDTAILNQLAQPILTQVYALYGIEPKRIINCSLQSHHTSFEKLSYDETFKVLNEN